MLLDISNVLFLIPELLQTILELLDGRDIARLATTSRQLFNLCMPFAWREVSGVEQLFTLLPRVTSIRKLKYLDYLTEFLVLLIYVFLSSRDSQSGSTTEIC